MDHDNHAPLCPDESNRPLLSLDEFDRNNNDFNDTTSSSSSYMPSFLLRCAQKFSSPITNTSSCSNKKRLLDRQGRFYQSRGRWQIDTMGDVQRIVPPRVRRLRDDWFHSLAYTKTPRLFAFLFLWYTLTICFWAAVYYFVSQLRTGDGNNSPSPHPNDKGETFCGMDISNWMEALYFSLSTMSGIGYGVSDYYFGDCIIPFVLVLAQILNGIAFDAVAIGLLFQRMSRGQKRGRTIIFSHQAVIQRVQGQYYFMVRIGELRSRHIVDARVRVYCIRHERYPTHGIVVNDESTIVPIHSFHFITRHVPLLCEDSSLLMSLPHVLIHKMDWKSPLVPPIPEWYDMQGMKHTTLQPNFENNRLTHNNEHYTRERENIFEFLQDREAEIVVLLEGTDEVSGTAVQARHSYRWDDVKFDCMFSNCVYPVSDDNNWREEDNTSSSPLDLNIFQGEGERMAPYSQRGSISATKCIIDFRKFHEVIAAPVDGDWCPYIPTWAYYNNNTKHAKKLL